MVNSGLRTIVLAVAVSLLAAACGGSDGGSTTATAAVPTPGLPTTYTGPDEVTSTVEAAARIVSLSGDFSEIVWELGLADNLVAVDLSSVYPSEVMRTKPRIGVEFVLLAEPIIAQEPTVVLGDIDAAPQAVIDQVRQAGIPVVIFPRLTGLGAPAEKIRQVGEVLGVSERAERLAIRVQAEVDAAVALAEGVEERPPTVFLYIASQSTMLLLGSNTVVDGMMAAVGAIDVGPPAGPDGFLPLTPEALVAAAPEVILTAERGFERVGGLDGFLEIPGVAQTPAGRAGRILVFEDLYLLGLGPRFGQALHDVVVGLHPELAAGA